MGSFKLFWNTHKWIGIGLSAVFACTAVTGFMLLIKKRVDWIQPPTLVGAAGEARVFVPLQTAFDVVLACDHPDFCTVDDIDRVDVRPAKRVYKVRSKRNDAEIQVCAVTGEILSIAVRRSDLLERIHDGSFFAGWIHDWLMPITSVALLFMVFSGWFLWLEPKVRRRRWRRRRAASGSSAAR